MQGVYNYIPEINIVSRVNIVAAIQQLQVMVHDLLRSALFWNITQLVVVMLFTMLNVLYINISTFRSKWTVPGMSFIRSSLILCLLGTVLNYSEIVPVAPVVTGITCVLHCTCAVFIL
jgi:hypothetical protein